MEGERLTTGAEGRRRRGRPRLRLEDCRKTDLAGVGGVETVGGDSSETGSVTKKKGKNRRLAVPAFY